MRDTPPGTFDARTVDAGWNKAGCTATSELASHPSSATAVSHAAAGVRCSCAPGAGMGGVSTTAAGAGHCGALGAGGGGISVAAAGAGHCGAPGAGGEGNSAALAGGHPLGGSGTGTCGVAPADDERFARAARFAGARDSTVTPTATRLATAARTAPQCGQDRRPGGTESAQDGQARDSMTMTNLVPPRSGWAFKAAG